MSELNYFEMWQEPDDVSVDYYPYPQDRNRHEVYEFVREKCHWVDRLDEYRVEMFRNQRGYPTAYTYRDESLVGICFITDDYVWNTYDDGTYDKIEH